MKECRQKWVTRLAQAGCLSGIMLTSSPLAFAQTDAEEDAEGNDRMVMDTIVTSALREESLQTVPIAVTAFSAETLRDARVENYLDLTRIAPNFSFDKLTGVGYATPTLRGIGASGAADSTISTAPPIGVYVDGVYMAAAAGNLFDVLDVERVEILRGPQGTLYGRNTLAGVVNIITKKPSSELEADASVGVGNFNRYDLAASLSGPIVKDRLAGRLGLYYLNRDGYTENTFSDPDPAFQQSSDDVDSLENLTLRGALDFQATDQLSFVLTGDYSDADGTYLGYQIEDGALFEAYGLGAYMDTDGDVHKGAYQSDNDETSRNWGVSLTSELELDQLRLVSITGYRDSYYIDEQSDIDGTPFNLYSQFLEVEEDNFSQELRFHYDTENTAWILGAYYFEASAQQDTLDDVFGYVREAGTPSGWFINRLLVTADTESWAVFANADFDLTEKLTLSLGARYTESERSIDRAFARSENGGQFYNGAISFDEVPAGFIVAETPGYPIRASETFEKFTPRIALEYNFTEDVFGYASYSEGFRDGGYITRSTSTTAFEPETLRAYELGLKTTTFDRKLQINTAAYFYDYTDQQVESSDFSGGVLAIDVQNAGESEAYGVEIEFVATPTEALTIQGNLGLQETEFKDFTLGPSSFEGNEFPQAAGLSSFLAVEYEWPLDQIGDLRVRGEWAYRDDSFQTFENDPLEFVDGYNLLNANIALQLNDQWRVSAWGRNLTDEEYVTKSLDLTGFFGYVLRHYGEPRTFGVSVDWTY